MSCGVDKIICLEHKPIFLAGVIAKRQPQLNISPERRSPLSPLINTSLGYPRLWIVQVGYTDSSYQAILRRQLYMSDGVTKLKKG